MTEKKTGKLRPPAIVEIIFDTVYLLFALCAGIWMVGRSDFSNIPLLLYGILALMLGCGDSFHLIPRILGHVYGMERYNYWLGIGKLVTSVTMTVFYNLLFFIWSIVLEQKMHVALLAILLVLSLLRIGLCIHPGNRWTKEDAPVNWAVYRNLPFLVIGLIIVILYGIKFQEPGNPFKWMSVAVCLSFAFYIPVVLYAKKYPWTGSLMLPKTAAYIWMICMGFALK